MVVVVVGVVGVGGGRGGVVGEAEVEAFVDDCVEDWGGTGG